MDGQPEIWQVEAGGAIYEAAIEELAQWIEEGALLPQDKVRRGNLRWLEAGKIPLLFGFFNAKELGLPMPILQTATIAAKPETNVSMRAENIVLPEAKIENKPPEKAEEIFPAQQNAANENPNFSATLSEELAPQNPAICFVHPQNSPVYQCEGCANFFCKACPKSFGGAVKICPLCGAMCQPLREIVEKREKIFQKQFASEQNFGFEDIGRAFAFPFKFKTSLFFGALMFLFFSLGESAAGIGGMYLIGASVFCLMLANTLTFGILANTVENFSQGETSRNFMPDFEDFNLWDDVVHPFFLSVGVYLVSFGLLLALFVGAVWHSWKAVKAEQNPQLSQIAEQLKQVRQENRIDSNGLMTTEKNMTAEQQTALQEGNLGKVQELMQKQRAAQFESIAGDNPETGRTESLTMWTAVAKNSLIFIILMFPALIWGLFYFPAASAVAGYTRSFTATINPFVGLDTIKHLGFDYAKILGLCLILVIFSIVFSGILGLIFSPLDLPRVGNLPVKAISSLLTFYFTIVFSVSLGFALFKNGEKLKLYRS